MEWNAIARLDLGDVAQDHGEGLNASGKGGEEAADAVEVADLVAQSVEHGTYGIEQTFEEQPKEPRAGQRVDPNVGEPEKISDRSEREIPSRRELSAGASRPQASSAPLLRVPPEN